MNMKAGVKNFLMVGSMSVLFIVVMKVVLNKYPFAGLTEVANAV